MFYWELKEAVRELKRRRQDPVLVEKVHKFLNSGQVSCPLPIGPNLWGILTRHIIAARLEEKQFEERCRRMGLTPLCLGFVKDKFVLNNPSKTRLVRLYFEIGRGKNGGYRILRVDVLDLRQIPRDISLLKLQTKWGEALVEFHRRLRQVVGLTAQVLDISEWLKGFGSGSAIDYYPYLLGLAIVDTIYFENFESPGFPDLHTFNQKVVRPAWQRVYEEFGCVPLLVRHPDVSTPKEEDRILNRYPAEALQAIPPQFQGG